MSIFGELQDHAFNDILQVLRSRSGTLFLDRALEGRTVELTLRSGLLTALYLDGFPVPSHLRLLEIFRQLSRFPMGSFEFREEARGGSEFLRLPVSALAGWTVQEDVPDERLPHPGARFVLVQGEHAEEPNVLLNVPWAALHAGLQGGASAEDLSVSAGLPLRSVQAALAQLRDLNLLAPQRVAARSTADASLVQRVAAALRRFSVTRAS